ncbi:unnamed protein product [Phyllotreta striolata]|uniref:Centromere protein J C-terminal domain-containing protein n=1 Tax=Phyllotreta striolata TaxID=444603 RepID=A0A9N9TFZ6_PHYSR|nr:unnamed protein product [Phyllotreta striolata]
MSFKASPYLESLHELLSWQGRFDNLLVQKNKSKTSRNSTESDFSDGIEPLNESKSDNSNIQHSDFDWDNKAIVPTKPFTELLEEKLAEYQPNISPTKPKKPFLKKGAGLTRYKLTPKVWSPKTQAQRNHEKTISSKEVNQPVSTNHQNEPTPLKMPEVSIKSKAFWIKADENETDCETNNFKNAKYSFNNIKSNSEEDNHISNNEPDHSSNFDLNYSEKELQVFEMLEEKLADGFTSANSSIMQLLASTPNNRRKSNINGSNRDNSEMLSKILQSLKLITQNNRNGFIINSPLKNSATSFSDAEKWYTSNSRSQSSSSFYSEFEKTLETHEKVDTGVNTSYVEEQQCNRPKFEQCTGCVELRNKLSKLEKDIPNITLEKAKLCDFAKELESKRDDIQKEMEFMKLKYEKDLEDLREELAEEKVKSAKDKALVNMYLKESRPSRKDREQIDCLKRELTDLKELMKLKETKNGTTLARLRNQIKQFEKEKSELKNSLEYLQKENAKLTANQKVHKITDSKMLQQINRNLHKLTEETKLINNPSTVVNPENTTCKQKKNRRKSMGDVKDKVEDNPKIELNKTTNIPYSVDKDKDVEVIYNAKYTESDLEMRYESAFGLQTESAGRLSDSSRSAKDEIITAQTSFADGSQEIKYSNGCIKIISPDGNRISLKYSNGDLKEVYVSENIKKYYFLSKDVWLTKYGDGVELIEFSNGQKEKRFPDGRIEVVTLDGTKLKRFPGGTEEVHYPDGSKMVCSEDERIIYLPNGQIETHNKEYKKREYPDGTVKFVYSDGTEETRYANGRVRVKDIDGNLMSDSYESFSPKIS